MVAIKLRAGTFSPIIEAIIKLPIPEKQPFIATISSELLLLIILVQLFSNPQHVQAASIRIEPSLNVKAPDLLSRLSMTLAVVTRIIEVQSFFEMNSLKIIRAIRLVATISKLFKSDALEDVVLETPSIKRIGAAISRITIAKT